jgi:DNA-directed RNA polymerase subunit RPC12/RpoP
MSEHDNPNTKYACPECGHQLLTIIAPAEFNFDGDDQTTDVGIGVEWDGSTEARCRHCGAEFVLDEAVAGRDPNTPQPRRFDVHLNVTGHMRVTIELSGDTDEIEAETKAVQAALNEGRLAISLSKGGDAIFTDLNSVIGRTVAVRDDTEWLDFHVVPEGFTGIPEPEDD